MTPETVKDVGFGSIVLPGGSVASSLATSALAAGNVFNPPTKQAEPEEKVPHLIDHQLPSGENTRSGKKKNPQNPQLNYKQYFSIVVFNSEVPCICNQFNAQMFEMLRFLKRDHHLLKTDLVFCSRIV